MKKLFLLGGMLLMLTSCDITDYFMDESGVIKDKNGKNVDQKKIEDQSNFNFEATEMAKTKRPGMMS